MSKLREVGGTGGFRDPGSTPYRRAGRSLAPDGAPAIDRPVFIRLDVADACFVPTEPIVALDVNGDFGASPVWQDSNCLAIFHGDAFRFAWAAFHPDTSVHPLP